jgi:hypothetical protein
MGRQTCDQSQLFYLFNLEERISGPICCRRINPVVMRVLGDLRNRGPVRCGRQALSWQGPRRDRLVGVVPKSTPSLRLSPENTPPAGARRHRFFFFSGAMELGRAIWIQNALHYAHGLPAAFGRRCPP